MKRAGVCLLTGLALSLIGCQTPSGVVVALDGLSVAAAAAASFVPPPYTAYVQAAGEFAAFGASELTSSDSPATQTAKILAKAELLTAEQPDVRNADPQIRARIAAIEAALNAVVLIIQQLQPKTATLSARAHPVSTAELLNAKDAKLIAKIVARQVQIKRKLALRSPD